MLPHSSRPVPRQSPGEFSKLTHHEIEAFVPGFFGW